MRDDESAYYAKQLVENPVFKEACEKLEAAAVNRAAYAKPKEDEIRLSAMADIRAIRAFRSHCEALARNTRSQKDASADGAA